MSSRMLDEAGLREAMPMMAATGLPFLVHAELPGPIDAIAPTLANADGRKYFNYLHSRPDEAEVQAIRLIIRLVPRISVPRSYCSFGHLARPS